MPLYDYRCGNCGDFREFHPMSESGELQVCPLCRSPSVRTLSAPYVSGNDMFGLSTPGRRPNGTGSSWRTACGFGCSHSGCG
jgi:putative FmdB family regulatory protein